MESSENYNPPGFADKEDVRGNVPEGAWRNSAPMASVERPRGRKYQHGALQNRDEFMDYFSNEGAVPWQIAMVTNAGPVLSSSDSEASPDYDSSFHYDSSPDHYESLSDRSSSS